MFFQYQYEVLLPILDCSISSTSFAPNDSSIAYLEKWLHWSFKFFWKKELISTKSHNLRVWTANIVDYGYFRPLPYGMVCVYIYIYGHRPPQALHFVGPKGDKHIYTYQCNMKWWKNHGKTHIKCMMPVPSSQSCVAIILGLLFFLSAEIRPKNGNNKYNNPSFNLNTWIQVQTMKSWISEDCSTKNPKIQKSIFSNRIFGFRSKRWIFGFPKVFLDFFGFFERVFGFLGFQVKNPKKLKEKDGIFKKSKKPKEKDGFLQKSKKT